MEERFNVTELDYGIKKKKKKISKTISCLPDAVSSLPETPKVK